MSSSACLPSANFLIGPSSGAPSTLMMRSKTISFAFSDGEPFATLVMRLWSLSERPKLPLVGSRSIRHVTV